jgi:hypothetical protein
LTRSRAREIGVDLLDTADGYGRGRNEELVAEAVREHRGDYVIASKFGNLGLLGDPRFADGRPEYVREACEKSLGRLKTDVIDLLPAMTFPGGAPDMDRPRAQSSATSLKARRVFRRWSGSSLFWAGLDRQPRIELVSMYLLPRNRWPRSHA